MRYPAEWLPSFTWARTLEVVPAAWSLCGVPVGFREASKQVEYREPVPKPLLSDIVPADDRNENY